MYEYSLFEIYFFIAEISKFSLTNNIKFSLDLLKTRFLKLILIFIKFQFNLYEIMLYMNKLIIFQWKN